MAPANVLAPSLITVPTSNSTGSYTISWGASATPGVTYTLEESSDAFATSSVVVSGLSGTSYLITGKTGGTYSYRVKAVNAPMPDSPWTTSGNNVNVVLPTVVTSPVGEVLTAGQVHQVTWTPGTNAVRFNLWYRSVNSGDLGITLNGAITGNSYSWMVPIDVGAGHQFFVKAYDVNGNWINNYWADGTFEILPEIP